MSPGGGDMVQAHEEAALAASSTIDADALAAATFPFFTGSHHELMAGMGSKSRTRRTCGRAVLPGTGIVTSCPC